MSVGWAMNKNWVLSYLKTMARPDTVFQQSIEEIPLAAKTREEALVEANEEWQKIKDMRREGLFTVNNSYPFLCFKEPLEEK